MRKTFAVTAGILLLATVPTAAQVPVGLPGPPRLGIGIAPHIGTLGIGVDIAVGGAGPLAVRAGANVLPFDISLTEADIEYSISPPSTHFTLLVDLATPVGFRATAGLLFSPSDIEATGQLVGTTTIGNVVYTSAEIGTLSGAIIHKDVAPYLGIGWGKPASSRLGFFLDLGVAFHGTPSVTLNADGLLRSDPTFLAELETERAEFEDEISWLAVYPVISLGFSIGI